jgi:hypothetical protein
MRLNEIQIQNLQIEYQLLVDKMLELENRLDNVEGEQEKNILSGLIERYYWKIYTMNADYNLLVKK